MVSFEVMALLLAGTVLTVVAVTVGAVKLARMVQAASQGPQGQSMPENTSPASPYVDASVFRGLSERLGILEGRLPALIQTLDGYGAISSRLADMEARLPALIDAYDKFSSISLNTEKRRLEQERRAEKKREAAGGDVPEISVKEAAEKMGMATQPQPNSANDLPVQHPSQIGAYGQGGPSRKRR